ncbi:MAG TPA: DUF4215 domain-containing protein, partial [Polyangiaceae bacterium]|nr:DUF4215 domain-containing protein [Polyangiaceae bacterium]
MLLLAACGGNPSVTDGPQGSAGTGTSTGGTSNGGPDGGTAMGAAGDNNLGPLGPPTGVDGGFGGSNNQPPAGCGDGTQDVGEACDDGNQQSGDGCNDQCLIEPGYQCDGEGCFQCGNGVLESTEDCDDGNPDNGDGCSSTCDVEPGGFYCPVPGEPCELCGDGVLDPNESCDDGNTNDADGCAADCSSIEPNFNCTTAGDPCELCGDGVVIAPEVCDDSNNANGDGCRFDCLAVEAGWLCDSNGCAYCGNGIDEPGEACDDGNQQNGDGCADDCNSVEAGFACPVAGAACEECGNGIEESTETCDDGNTTGNDGCQADCGGIDPGWVCVLPGQECGLCGNGLVEDNEICDDGGQCAGGTNDGTTCTSDAACTGGGQCEPQANDGCDDECTDIEDDFKCYAQGTPCEECGDGTEDANETCDDGNTQNGDGCRWDCGAIEQGWVCDVGVDCANCGNGVIEGNEVCDDGNELAGDGCNATCSAEEVGFDCVAPGTACEKCGNGIEESSEVCDDGGQCLGGTNADAPCTLNTQCDSGACTPRSSDGCSATCKTVEPGFICHVPGQGCQRCGNGVVDANEVCDDGGKCANGTNNGTSCTSDATCTGGGVCLAQGNDGCNAACNQIEQYYRCPTPGAACLKCGDNVLQSPEVCDDGNNTSADGCRADCKVIESGFVGPPGGGACNLCANGVVNTAQGETCDDSNANDGDGCSATCQEEGAPFNCFTDGVACDRCGNGVREASETCDDGGECRNGTNNGAACDGDSDCTGGGDCFPVAGDGCGLTCQTEAGWVCPVPGLPCGLCGNSTVEPNEVCDDGKHCIGGADAGEVCTVNGTCLSNVCAPRSGDGCDNLCSEVEPNFACPTPGQPCEECGDGNVVAPEVCDDGNALGGDGCSFNCRVVENGFSCPPAGGACTSCGNGDVEAGELCDDGNAQSGDGCSDDCDTVESGYRCEVEGALCYRCGNGVKEGTEACDDGNTNNSDGCHGTLCTVDAGWTCPVAGVGCGNCGNGTVEAIEICDDGRDCVGGTTPGAACTSDANCGAGGTCPAPASGDGCNSTCTAIEANHRCITPGQPCIECGDGVVSAPHEVCDDGDAVGGDGCSYNCTVEEAGFDCVTPGQACLECGNGNIEGSEACDDNNRQSGDGCSSTCTVELYFDCPDNGTPIEGQLCQRCGNGAKESLEQCDDGGKCQGGTNANGTCTSNSQCPGGSCVPQANDGCTADCDLQGGGWICPYPGQPCELCGDGLATSSEICDDGRKCVGGADAGEVCVTGATCLSNNCQPVSNDGCSSNCQDEEDWYDCPVNGGACTYTVVCGDGRKGDQEQCDDGDVPPASNDGCSSTCQLEPGYYCPTPGQACALIPFCGDGLQAGNEECDDGDFPPAAGDGCDANCDIEANWACPTPGQPCVDVTVVCGDGVLGGTEACDDGKRCVGGTNPGAICSTSANCTGGGTCQPSSSGNLVCYGGVDNDLTCDANNDCTPGVGSIRYVSVNNYTTASTTFSQSVTLTSAAGTGRMVVVGFGGQAGGTRTVTSATLGGVAMHAINSATVGTGNRNMAFLYYLAESELPAPGARTLSVTMSGTIQEFMYSVYQLENVANQAPEANNTNTATNVTSIATNITTLTANAWVIDFVTNDDQGHTFSPAANQQTERGEMGATESRMATGTREVGSPGQVTNTWNISVSSGRVAHVLAAFKAGPGTIYCQSEGGDGCSNACQVDPGWACPIANTNCVAEDCGDGLLAGSEECESNLTTPASACLSDCTLDPAYGCQWDAIGHEVNCALIATACDNDGIKELGEACDNGNNEVNDGCTPNCEVRPNCPKSGGACSSQCGDSIILPADAEVCDDGNNAAGDGCSAACAQETGYTCTLTQGALPATITIPFVFRDFISLPSQTTALQRHPDFESRCMSSQQDGLVNATLSATGKPVNTGICNLPAGCAIDIDYTAGAGCGTVRETCDGACGCNGCEGQTHGLHPIAGHPGDPFNFWYTDETNVNKTKVVQTTLTKDANDKYTYNPGALYPLDDDGWVASGDELEDGGHNYGFTSEVRYWFQYQGGEILTFAGDDDVWVFVNGKL